MLNFQLPLPLSQSPRTTMVLSVLTSFWKKGISHIWTWWHSSLTFWLPVPREWDLLWLHPSWMRFFSCSSSLTEFQSVRTPEQCLLKIENIHFVSMTVFWGCWIKNVYICLDTSLWPSSPSKILMSLFWNFLCSTQTCHKVGGGKNYFVKMVLGVEKEFLILGKPEIYHLLIIIDSYFVPLS